MLLLIFLNLYCVSEEKFMENLNDFITVKSLPFVALRNLFSKQGFSLVLKGEETSVSERVKRRFSIFFLFF